MPLLGEALPALASLVARAATLLLVLSAIHQWTAGWTQRRAWGALITIVAGGLVALTRNPPDPASWLLQAMLTGVLLLAMYVWALRFDLTLIPFAVGTLMGLGLLRAAYQRAYPGAFSSCLIGAALVILVGWRLSLALRGGVAPDRESAAST